MKYERKAVKLSNGALFVNLEEEGGYPQYDYETEDLCIGSFHEAWLSKEVEYDSETNVETPIKARLMLNGKYGEFAGLTLSLEDYDKIKSVLCERDLKKIN